MKPTEHKPQLEKELIAHIRESLVEHEEQYVAGAWEKFNAPEKKRRPILWMPFLRGAAAILLIGTLTFLFVSKKPVTEQITKVEADKSELVEKAPRANKEIITQKSIEIFKSEKPFNASLENNKIDDQDQKLNKVVVDQDKTEIQNQQPVIANNQLENQQKRNDIAIEIPIGKPNQETIVTNKTEEQKVNIIDFLTNETKNNKTKDVTALTDKKQSKFTVGLVVAPSFGNVKRLNMGYGISVDYSLSDKFSLNSGLAYNQMAASAGVQNNNSLAADMPVASAIAKTGSTKSLESIEEQVTGIDIPLEIKYYINKNIYANFGVSAFAVINQKRNNTYLEGKIVQSADASNNNTFSSMLVTERVTEKETPTKAEDYSYLGFYNLSFGYKKKISKNNSFAIEPFLKLPMKEVKTENLKLIGTGVKLKFDF